jgi:beta-lactamase superfamily II metal-dependent hydrolase
MKYEVEMIDVKAADAFLIHYIDDFEISHIIMVDSGNYEDSDKIINHIRNYYDTVPIPGWAGYVIDIAVVTHPDDDHIGGYVHMLEDIRDGKLKDFHFNSFWVNDPTKHEFEPEDVKGVKTQKSLDAKLKSVYNYQEDESKNLLDLIDWLGIHREEAFAREYVNKPKITILSPTKEYYESLLPNFRNRVKFLWNLEALEENKYSEDKDISDNYTLSKTLDDAKDDASAHNQSSIVFLLETDEGDKYLFTGDAGRDAFNHVPQDLLESIKGVKWMKVPHHGSKHNLDSTIIRHVNPEIAYISTEKVEKYLNRCTVFALKKNNTKVYSTSQHRSSIRYGSIKARVGWSDIEPM